MNNKKAEERTGRIARYTDRAINRDIKERSRAIAQESHTCGRRIVAATPTKASWRFAIPETASNWALYRRLLLR